MEWLGHLFEKYPEMAVYLAIGVGYLIGAVKFRGAGLGAVTGSLLAGSSYRKFLSCPCLGYGQVDSLSHVSIRHRILRGAQLFPQY